MTHFNRTNGRRSKLFASLLNTASKPDFPLLPSSQYMLYSTCLSSTDRSRPMTVSPSTFKIRICFHCNTPAWQRWSVLECQRRHFLNGSQCSLFTSCTVMWHVTCRGRPVHLHYTVSIIKRYFREDFISSPHNLFQVSYYFSLDHFHLQKGSPQK